MGLELVPCSNVPAVLVQVVDEVNIVAETQASFDGGVGGLITQIVNLLLVVDELAVVLPVTYTRR